MSNVSITIAGTTYEAHELPEDRCENHRESLNIIIGSIKFVDVSVISLRDDPGQILEPFELVMAETTGNPTSSALMLIEYSGVASHRIITNGIGFRFLCDSEGNSNRMYVMYKSHQNFALSKKDISSYLSKMFES